MTKIEKIGFTSAYAQHIGRRPWLEAGVLGTAGGLAGYHGMKFFAPKALEFLMVGKSKEVRQQMFEDFHADGTMQYLKNLGAGIGALTGVAYTLGKHLDIGSGFKGAWESMKDSRYWGTPVGKARIKEMRKGRHRSQEEEGLARSTGYSSGLRKTGMLKTGKWGDPLFNSERIPVSYSLNLINADPFLTLSEKDIMGTVLEGAEGGNSGLVSGRDIARSAVQIGIGGSVGILLGKAVGALLSLPSPVTRRLSIVGAIAGALTNTGVFSEIKQ